MVKHLLGFEKNLHFNSKIMAIIKKIKRQIDWLEWEFKIKVNSSWCFTTEYPENFRSRVDMKSYYSDLWSLISAIDSWIYEYERLTEKIELLLFYRIEIRYPQWLNSWFRLWVIYQPLKKVTLWESIKYYHISKNMWWEEKEWDIIPWYRTCANEYDRFRSFSSKDIEIDSDNKIPLTVENIKFFEDVEKWMKSLHELLEDKLWTPESVLQMIWSWKKLLPENKEWTNNK